MIKVCGSNYINQLYKNSNNKDTHLEPTIYPPIELHIKPPLVLSYSISYNHSVLITRHGTLYGIGNNLYGEICCSLPRTRLTDFTQFIIQNEAGKKMIPISAVCCSLFTLYIVSASLESEPQLAFSYHYIRGQIPLFLRLNGRYPVSLFGGRTIYAAVIDNVGEVVLINLHKTQMSNGEIKSYGLPLKEKASSVAFGSDELFVLSSTGKIYQSQIQFFSDHLEFVSVIELNSSFQFTEISGKEFNVFAVTNDGRVFGKGQIENGLPIKEDEEDAKDSFTEICELKSYNIKAAFAGTDHSLFLTDEGKVLACGKNSCGQLNIEDGPSDEHVFLPVETTIKSGCSFCIAGSEFSAFFIDCDPPPNIPNKKVEDAQKVTPEYLMSSFDYKVSEDLINNSTEMSESSYRILSVDEIESFKEKRLVGHGGQSHVYKVVKDGKKYALKVINTALPNDQLFECMNHLYIEYEAIKTLHHPNIIKTFGIFLGDSDHSPSILLEFCPFNLFSMIKKFSKEQRVVAVFEIASAMNEVHKHNLIHRDLKPENILLDESLHVKVSDFGISKFGNDRNTKTIGIGPLKFMAPEILNDDNYTIKVDVYSFGILMFYILNNGKYPKINITNIASGMTTPIPENFNAFSRELLTKCWKFNPDERISFAQIIEEIERNDFKLIDNVEVEKVKEILLLK